MLVSSVRGGASQCACRTWCRISQGSPCLKRDAPVGAVRQAGDDVFALALNLGGTVTGEHGVGLLKRDWLAREVGQDILDVQNSIKAALDPRGILNPAKGF